MAEENNQPTEQPAAQPQEQTSHKVVEKSIELEMKKCYIDYAMSVIVGRALPDVRDGLKPVHRRILYSMSDLGMSPNKPHKKSARVVGECFVKGTRVLTSKGLLPIENIEVGDKVYTQSGISTVTELFEMPERKLCKIELATGLSVTATPSQPIKVITPNLTYEWKLAKDIIKGDQVVIRLEYPDLQKLPLPDWNGAERFLDEDMAYLIGQFLSDGWFENDNHRFVFFSTSEEVLNRVHDCLERFFGFDVPVTADTYELIRENGDHVTNIRYQLRVNRKAVNDYIMGIFSIDASWKAESKKIPDLFFQSPRSVITALMAGMYDGDGSIHLERNVIHYGTVSSEMADGLQLLQQHLGILSNRYVQKPGDDVRIDGRLIHSNYALHAIETKGRFAKLLSKVLDLANLDKKERIQRIATAELKVTSFDRIPYSAGPVFTELTNHHLGSGWYEDTDGQKFRSGIAYPSGSKIRYSSSLKTSNLGRTQLVDWGIQSKLERVGSGIAPFFEDILDHNLFFVPVSRVSKVAAEKTYDLQVAGAHEFVANGILAHNCLGKYHPHGDTAVYDSLVRMAQDFSLRYTLIDGQGNFGSVDGDEAAAMRYTECRLNKIAETMLADIDKETINFVDNFDGSLKEPETLPSMLPNLLVNGTAGIAVGMATNMPPHNLNEIVDAIVHLVDHPEAEIYELMQFVKGPDFPTGGTIAGIGGIMEAYQTGRGKLRVRARTFIEEKDGRTRIIVDEIPYQVNKAKLIENIAELVKDKKIEGITDLRDESDRDGMRIVVELRKDVMPEIVLNHLYKQTQMETTFGVINIALVNNEPRVLTLKELMEHYILYRKEVVVRRTKYDLAQARKREHIIIALIKAVDAIDETLHIIRSAQTPEEARNGLMVRFEIDEEQAKAILDMRLQKLTGLEIESLRQEFVELEKLISDLLDILANEARVLTIIKDEALEMKAKFGDERKTEIVADARDMEDEDLIPNEDMVVMATSDGYIKRVPLDTYKQQRRGGIGLSGMETKEEDFVTDMFVTLTHNYLMFFTNMGKVYVLKAYKLPVGSRQSKGKAIVNLLPKLEEGEKIMTTIPTADIGGEKYLVFATKMGIIKKTELQAYANIRSCGIIAVGLEEKDELVDVKITDGTKEIILATKDGQAARFEETQVRPMGRPAHGVIGIRMDEGDEVVSMAVVTPLSQLLTITENGYGKITPVGKADPTDEHDVYRKTNRGGKGVITIRTDEGGRKVVKVVEVEDEDELVVATKSSNVQRIRASEIRKTGRTAMGVRIMKLREDDKVIAVARLVGQAAEKAVEQAEAKGDALITEQNEPEGL